MTQWVELQAPGLEEGLAAKTAPLSKWCRAFLSLHQLPVPPLEQKPHGMVTTLPQLRKVGHYKYLTWDEIP